MTGTDRCAFSLSHADWREERATRFPLAERETDASWQCPRDAPAGADRCAYHKRPSDRDPSDAELVDRYLDELRAGRSPKHGDGYPTLVGARFETLDLGHIDVAANHPYPIDLRCATVETLRCNHAIVGLPVRADGLTATTVEAVQTTFERPLSLADVSVEEDVILADSTVGGALSLTGASVGGRCDLSRAAVDDGLDASELTVGGALRCPSLDVDETVALRRCSVERFELGAPDERSPGRESAYRSTQSFSSTIDGDLLLTGTVVTGNLTIAAVHVAGRLDCDDCFVEGRTAVEDSLIERNLRGEGWYAADRVRISGQVGGRVRLSQSVFAGGLSAGGVFGEIKFDGVASERLVLDGEVDGQVSLRDSVCTDDVVCGGSLDGRFVVRDSRLGGSVVLSDASVRGSVDVRSTTIVDALTLDRADVDAERIRVINSTIGSGVGAVDADLDCRVRIADTQIGWELTFRGATIEGTLDVSASIRHPGFQVVTLREATVAALDVPDADDTPPLYVDLTDATFGEIRDQTGDWNPRQVRFLETQFDDFPFETYRTNFAREDWNVHTLAERGELGGDDVDAEAPSELFAGRTVVEFAAHKRIGSVWARAMVARLTNSDDAEKWRRVPPGVLLWDAATRDVRAAVVESAPWDSDRLDDWVTKTPLTEADVAEFMAAARGEPDSTKPPGDSPAVASVPETVERLQDVMREGGPTATAFERTDVGGHLTFGEPSGVEARLLLKQVTCQRSIGRFVVSSLLEDDEAAATLAEARPPSVAEVEGFLADEPVDHDGLTRLRAFDIDHVFWEEAATVRGVFDAVQRLATAVVDDGLVAVALENRDDAFAVPPEREASRLEADLQMGLCYGLVDSDPTPSIAELESTYLKAKNGSDDVGDSTSAAEFFVKEMQYAGRRSRRRWLAGSPADTLRRERLPAATSYVTNRFLYWSSGFGERPLRVLASSGVVVGLFTPVYALALWDGTSATRTLLDAFTLSLGAFVALLLDGHGVASPMLELVTEFEGFLGVFIIGLFVFTLTRSVHR
ncbi:MAG: hypothetical protein ABEJ82_06975 [Haloplanus sp.]